MAIKHQHHHHGTRSSKKIFPPNVLKDNKNRFGYLFNYSTNQKLAYTPNNRALLEALGETMIATQPIEDSSIPSGYTYLGQFIDHDIDRDATSSLDFEQNAAKILNFRSPRLDLDSVYGLGPAIQPFLYDKSDRIKLLIGKNKSGSKNLDLPRTQDGTAIIGDPRNDENILVAQTHLAFLKFHNAVIDRFRIEQPNLSDDAVFELAKEAVTLHYQWVVINDFLKTIADEDIVNQTFLNGNQYFVQRSGYPRKMIMPVEFSVAAYRFGHSMVRDTYKMNDIQIRNTDFMDIFRLTGARLPSEFIIDWTKFFKIESNFQGNFARKIDTNLAEPLSDLPEGSGLAPIMKFLAKRNLVRSMALGVPTGQAMATFFERAIMPAHVLLENANPQATEALQQNNGFLQNNTPLWYYILKESEVRDNGKLGEIGSLILAETFYRMLKLDKKSIINKSSWRPFLGEHDQQFTMIDLLKVAGVVANG